jgi:hypothetical protein
MLSIPVSLDIEAQIMTATARASPRCFGQRGRDRDRDGDRDRDRDRGGTSVEEELSTLTII